MSCVVPILWSLISLLSVTPEARDTAWVDKRVAEIQPTSDERKIDRIGWAADIRTALALGKTHNRPIFLFTHDGRMGTGRC
jgi:hypothetical protein